MEADEAPGSAGSGGRFPLWPFVMADAAAVPFLILVDLGLLSLTIFYLLVICAAGAIMVETYRWLRPRGIRGTLASLNEVARQPPNRMFHLLLVIPAATLLIAVSTPGGNFGLGLLAFLMLPVAAAVWAGRVISYLIMRYRGTPVGDGRWLLVAPLAGLAVAGVVALDGPLRARWALSQSAFDAARLGSDTGGIVGLYDTDDARRLENGVRIPVHGAGFLGEYGFAYLPGGPEPADDVLNLEHLGGDWYTYSVTWD